MTQLQATGQDILPPCGHGLCSHIHFGLDPGKLVQWMGGEYMGKRRNVQWTLAAVWDHVHTNDYLHMQQILQDGSPFDLAFDKL